MLRDASFGVSVMGAEAFPWCILEAWLTQAPTLLLLDSCEGCTARVREGRANDLDGVPEAPSEFKEEEEEGRSGEPYRKGKERVTQLYLPTKAA
eukprot:1147121-Pelagomonas_calceolata.AAC.4